MSNDLQARPSTLLRPMFAGDLATLDRLVKQVSWPHRAQDCAQMFEIGTGIAAIDETGAMIGAGMRWSFGRDAGTIGMVLVAPEKQGTGVGRSLMTALIAGSGSRALMLNATPEGLPLYEKLGFVASGLVRQHQATPGRSLALPPAPSVAPRRAVPADHAALCAIDAVAFGADRSTLVERLLAAGEAWVVDRTERPTGFAILRAFGRGMMIGPVVAPSEDEAVALVATAVGAAPPGVLRIDIPAQAGSLGEWLTAAGLPAVDTVTTMLRGDWPAAAKEFQRFGLAAQALG